MSSSRTRRYAGALSVVTSTGAGPCVCDHDRARLTQQTPPHPDRDHLTREPEPGKRRPLDHRPDPARSTHPHCLLAGRADVLGQRNRPIEVHQQVAGQLSQPLAGRVRGHPRRIRTRRVACSTTTKPYRRVGPRSPDGTGRRRGSREPEPSGTAPKSDRGAAAPDPDATPPREHARRRHRTKSQVSEVAEFRAPTGSVTRWTL